MQTAALTQSLLIGLRTSKILPWLDLCLVVWTACWVLSTGAENTVPNWLCNVSSWSTWCLSCCTSRTNACSCQQFWAAFEATLNPKMEWTIVENVSGMAPLRTGQFEWVSGEWWSLQLLHLLGECCNAVLVWSSREFLWTTKKWWLDFYCWVNCSFNVLWIQNEYYKE